MRATASRSSGNRSATSAGASEHALVVAAPLALAAVERGAVADRDEHVLERRAPRVVRVHVAGRDRRRRRASRRGRAGARSGARRRARTGAGARRRSGRGRTRCASRAAAFGSRTREPVARAAGEADEPLVQLLEQRADRAPAASGSALLPGGRVCACAAREQPAEVRVALRRLDEQRHVRAVGERDLGAGDRPDAEVLRRVRELERPVDAVVVGERERLVAELGRARGELLRLRGAVEERVGRVGVQLDVRRRAATASGISRPASGAMRNSVELDAARRRGVVLRPGEGESLFGGRIVLKATLRPAHDHGVVLPQTRGRRRRAALPPRARRLVLRARGRARRRSSTTRSTLLDPGAFVSRAARASCTASATTSRGALPQLPHAGRRLCRRACARATAASRAAFDSVDAAPGSGRPPTEAVVLRPGEGERLAASNRVATIKVGREELALIEFELEPRLRRARPARPRRPHRLVLRPRGRGRRSCRRRDGPRCGPARSSRRRPASSTRSERRRRAGRAS